MAAENWIQRASGLVVPARGFANHPLGRWQPCVGPCCEIATCGCAGWEGGVASNDIEIEIDFGLGGWTNVNCDHCVDIKGKFILTFNREYVSGGVWDVCEWEYEDLQFCDYPGEGYYGLQLIYDIVSGHDNPTSDWFRQIWVQVRKEDAIPGETKSTWYYADAMNAWSYTDACDTPYDANDENDLSPDSESHSGPDPPCAGTLPDPLTFKILYP